jgi:hypothetical protein
MNIVKLVKSKYSKKIIKFMFAKTVLKTVSYVLLRTLAKDVTLEPTYSTISVTRTVLTTTETTIMLLQPAFVVPAPKTVLNVMLTLVLNVTLPSLFRLKIPRPVYKTVKKEVSNNWLLLTPMKVMFVDHAVFSAKLAQMLRLAHPVSTN